RPIHLQWSRARNAAEADGWVAVTIAALLIISPFVLFYAVFLRNKWQALQEPTYLRFEGPIKFRGSDSRRSFSISFADRVINVSREIDSIPWGTIEFTRTGSIIF